MTRTTAVIIARKGSVRIPHKMHEKINGESLIIRKTRQCVNIRGIHRVIVGSDDESIKNDVEELGARFVLREPKYCDEVSAPVNSVVRNMLSFFESDMVLWAHPTNPFIDSTDYEEAIKFSNCEDVVSVSELRGHFWNPSGNAINFDPSAEIHQIASKLNPIYAQNGGIFIRPYEKMARDGKLVTPNSQFYVMDQLKGWDIDERWQLEIAQIYAHKIDKPEFLLQKRFYEE